ncbi:hypothetical protein EDD11_005037 [Mortierella claussenii]|nr:hypothetical protein EDD11_005037 [Mortierella claussenii]
MSPTQSLASPYTPSLPYSRHIKSHHNSSALHSRTNSESLLFTPPLSPTEEQLLAFLIPDIEPSELAAYLSAPSTPILSDVSCLINKSVGLAQDHSPKIPSSHISTVEAVYPSPVCAAAAATVVALDRLDGDIYPTLSFSPSESHVDSMTRVQRKRCSTYAFMGSEDEDEDSDEPSDFPSGPVYVMSSRHTRKRLMLEQAFVSPDDDEDCSQSCYAQLFQDTCSNEMDSTSDLSSTLAFDLVLV